MIVESTKIENTVVFTPHGKLGIKDQFTFQDLIEEKAENASKVVFNLEDTSFIHSAIIPLFINCKKFLKVDVEIAFPNKTVQGLLSMAKIEPNIPVKLHGNIEDIIE